MQKSLLDTDIFSEVLKGINLKLKARADSYLAQHGKLTISTIQAMEVISGLQYAGMKERAESFKKDILSAVQVLSFDEPAAHLAGQIFADLKKRGQPIGLADPMTAGIALSLDPTLVTGNMDHFMRIQTLGYPLRLENWRE